MFIADIKVGMRLHHPRWPEHVYGNVTANDGRYVVLCVPYHPDDPGALYTDIIPIERLHGWEIWQPPRKSKKS